MYASSWFLTIFTTTLPLAVSSHIMDLFLMDGIEVIFRFALAMLSLARTQLLVFDLEGMLKVEQQFSVSVNIFMLMTDIDFFVLVSSERASS